MRDAKLLYLGMLFLLFSSTVTPILFQTTRQSPFSYVAPAYTDHGVAIYEPEGPICVGGAVRIPIHIRVNRVPVTIRLDDQLSDPATGASVLWSVIDYPDASYVEPSDVQAVLPVQIPDTVPPGNYRYLVVARTDGTSESGFLANITIKDCK